MKAGHEHKHDESTVAAALGLKRTGSELKKLLLSDVVPDTNTTSEAIEKIIKLADSPEEIAYMAYSTGELLVRAREGRL